MSTVASFHLVLTVRQHGRLVAAMFSLAGSDL